MREREEGKGEAIYLRSERNGCEGGRGRRKDIREVGEEIGGIIMKEGRVGKVDATRKLVGKIYEGKNVDGSVGKKSVERMENGVVDRRGARRRRKGVHNSVESKKDNVSGGENTVKQEEVGWYTRKDRRYKSIKSIFK